jgi:hypothetical protein
MLGAVHLDVPHRSRTPNGSGTMPALMESGAQARSRSSNKWDLEIAKVRSKMDVWRIVAYGVVIALGIAASALPLWMMHGIIQPLAGKKTEVDLNLPITIALGFSVVFNLAQHVKGRSRKGEIKRLRRRADKYEAEQGIGL